MELVAYFADKSRKNRLQFALDQQDSCLNKTSGPIQALQRAARNWSSIHLLQLEECSR